MWEDADAWKAEAAERACGIQSLPIARPAPRLIFREWLGLPNPEVAIKNWALCWTDGGHHRRQNRLMTAQNRSLASLALSDAARAEDRLENRN